MEKDSIIFHIDCNAFYASVEEILYPELKKTPMAVCGDPHSRRGIILAKNEKAKAYGVKTAETIWQAKQKCPQLVLRPARHSLYSQYSKKVNAIFSEYTDLVEPFGQDESYLDVTQSLHLFGNDPLHLAHAIRKRIPMELGLTVSVGISFNKIFAKLASDMKKPNAVTVISRENYQQTVWPLPVQTLLMVGRATEKTLHTLGIFTIGNLARADVGLLEKQLGKLGRQLHLSANGQGHTAVSAPDESSIPHSVGNGCTFKRDLVSFPDIKTAATHLSGTVSTRLLKHGLVCSGVQITIKDPQFKVITRQKTLETPTWLAADILEQSLFLIEQHWPNKKPIRMLTITAQKISGQHENIGQLSLFQTAPDIRHIKREKWEKAMDDIRSKYGFNSIIPANIICNDLGIYSGSLQEDRR